MKYILSILLLIVVSINGFSQTIPRFDDQFGKKLWKDTAFFNKVTWLLAGANLKDISAPSTPTSGYGALYVNGDSLRFKNDGGTVFTLGAGGSTPGIDNVLAVAQSLTTTRTIDVGSSDLIVSQSGIFTSTFGSSGAGLLATSATNAGLWGISSDDVAGVVGENSSVTVAPLQSGKNISNTHLSTPGLDIYRTTTGTAINGIGSKIRFITETSTGAQDTTNRIESYWKNATNSTRTAQFGIEGVSNTIQDTLMTLGDYVTLTESSATKFTSTTIATGKIQGGAMLVTVEGNDGTDFQSRTLRFIWSAVNKAGTLTITISTPEEVVAISNGSTLTATITGVDAGSGVLDFKVNAVSSLTQTTLRCTYQTFKNF